MVWGGISTLYKTPLIIFDAGSTLDSDTYIQCVFEETNIIQEMNNLYGPRNWLFQQDGAPAHKAQETISYIHDFMNILDSWPSHSPDLNVIEHVWGWMAAKISKVMPDNIDSLRDCLIEVWNSITPAHIKNLIDSMERRLIYVRD
jgi:transposase